MEEKYIKYKSSQIYKKNSFRLHKYITKMIKKSNEKGELRKLGFIENNLVYNTFIWFENGSIRLKRVFKL